MSNTVELVIKIVERTGWRVFPARPNKAPYVKNWQSVATNDPRKILNLFSLYQDAMIGLPTGPINNISVVDFDIRENMMGCRALERRGLHYQILFVFPRHPVVIIIILIQANLN